MNVTRTAKYEHSVVVRAVIGKGTLIKEPVNLYECSIGTNCKVGPMVNIEGGVRVGNNCKVKAFTFIPSGVRIGDNVFIGPRVTFTNDKYPRAQGRWKVIETVVEDGASIGAGAIILPGVRIGKNAMIGAGTIVTKDVPAGMLVYGNVPRVTKILRGCK